MKAKRLIRTLGVTALMSLALLAPTSVLAERGHDRDYGSHDRHGDRREHRRDHADYRHGHRFSHNKHKYKRGHKKHRRHGRLYAYSPRIQYKRRHNHRYYDYDNYGSYGLFLYSGPFGLFYIDDY